MEPTPRVTLAWTASTVPEPSFVLRDLTTGADHEIERPPEQVTSGHIPLDLTTGHRYELHARSVVDGLHFDSCLELDCVPQPA